MLLALVDQASAADILAFAATLGEPVHAAAFEPLDDLHKHGAGTLHAISHELLDGYSPEAYGEALAQLIAELRPIGVIAAGSDRSNELMAQAAARADLPLATNCVSVSPGQTWELTRLRGGGMLLEDAELTADVKLVTLAPGVSGPAPDAVDDVDLRNFRPTLSDNVIHTRVVEHATRSEGVTLATAPVVVSGGRGVGSKEGYAVLEELAELLGGAVGCSRVATNNGWRSHSDQVGLTGTKIAPRLYIACGISGATQHWVGCMDAKAILAINTDPAAAMVARATYAVIGDLHEVLPAVIAELRTRAGQ